MKRHPGKATFVCASAFLSTPLAADDSYVRVQELGNFIAYYAGPSAGYSSIDPDDVNEVRRLYFGSGGVQTWPDVTIEWSGGTGRVFVLSKHELSGLIAGAADPGSFVNDALGLGLKDGVGTSGKPELVAVQYPSGFSVSCVQPTSLDAWWFSADWYYVSQADIDTWGLTQSCSGSASCVRERVHPGLSSVPSGLSGFMIGIADSPLIEDRGRLLAEAYRRIP